jgi:C4-dicarboxylate-specific signal transduction histidine kinase
MTGLMALAIFVADTFTVLQGAVAVLYVLVLVVSDDGLRVRSVKMSAAACVLLACMSFFIDHGQTAEAEPVVRLMISLAAIAVTAALLVRNRRTQQAARASDLRYRTIFDTLAIAIWEHDFRDVKAAIDSVRASGVNDLRRYLTEHPEFVIRLRRLVRITDANNTALRLLHVTSKQHFFTHLADFLPEHDDSFFECILAIDEGRELFETETQVRTTKGDYIDILIALSFPPDGAGLDRICGSVLDVTERKRVEGMLTRTRTELDLATRAAAIAELSAGIAHEVSQPLSAVRTFIEAARRWLSRTPPDVTEALIAIDQAARAALGAGDVVDRVRRLMGRSVPNRSSLDVDEVVRAAVRLVQPQLGDTTLEIDLAAADREVVGDPVLLQQLLLALFVNALHAMDRAADASRRLTVRTRTRGFAITITVSDSGPGFTSEAAAAALRVFSGGRHEGAGMGLAMCRSIVEAHDGSIRIGSAERGAGAAIEVELPATPSGDNDGSGAIADP